MAARTRMMLEELDWPVRTFVEHLLDNRAEGEVDIDSLRDDLLDALLSAAELREVVLSSTLELAIVDNTDAVSSLVVDESFDATSLEVSVDIEHTYRGDLVVWLESPAGDTVLLHDRTGGSADGLHEAWSYEPETAIGTRGAWHLHVGDRAAADEGRLLGWSLTLRE